MAHIIYNSQVIHFNKKTSSFSLNVTRRFSAPVLPLLLPTSLKIKKILFRFDLGEVLGLPLPVELLLLSFPSAGMFSVVLFTVSAYYYSEVGGALLARI